eukprot:TRINITY_DN1527_c0_g1_i6.p1 TRINITY_DN1527_c0_g1~~TRINITY_DN1527_c0_g1_i6.p1  ORF type:complete len:273 (+),score=35.34 TRINITY_DN1527_c0_g1_i6:616-1434(+)
MIVLGVLSLILAFAVLRPPKKENKEENQSLVEKTPVWAKFGRATINTFRFSKYWLVLFILMVGFGTAVNFYNNTGSVAQTLGGGDKQEAYLMITFSFAQIAGRFLYTFLNSFVFQSVGGLWYAILILTGTLVGFILSIASFSSLTMSTLFVYVILDGISYGCFWAMLPLVANSKQVFPEAAERYNVQDVELYGLICLAPAFGPLIFDSISGTLYDQKADPLTKLCHGDKCYQRYFLIASIVLAVSFLLSQIWVYREVKRRREGSAELTRVIN